MSQIKRYLAVCDELRDANPDERMAKYLGALSRKRGRVKVSHPNQGTPGNKKAYIRRRNAEAKENQRLGREYSKHGRTRATQEAIETARQTSKWNKADYKQAQIKNAEIHSKTGRANKLHKNPDWNKSMHQRWQVGNMKLI